MPRVSATWREGTFGIHVVGALMKFLVTAFDPDIAVDILRGIDGGRA